MPAWPEPDGRHSMIDAQLESRVALVIDIPDSVVADLKERLTRARMPEEPECLGWQFGMNQAHLRQFIEYWRDEFDWRTPERRLNRLEQFKTGIDGLTSTSRTAGRPSPMRSR